MAEPRAHNLARLFQAVSEALEQNRVVLNETDSGNGNHGDHMVQVFRSAAQAAASAPASLDEAMQAAAQALAELDGNATAGVYARGLGQFAAQFRQRQVSLDELLAYVRGLAREKNAGGLETGEQPAAAASPRSGEVLKALVGGLSGWQQVEAGRPDAGERVEMGYLFDLGIIYLQARQRGAGQSATRIQVLADAAASASPLSQVPHRHRSGKLALQALLQAMAEG